MFRGPSACKPEHGENVAAAKKRSSVKPSADGNNGRTKDGKFAKGNPGGNGNPEWNRLHALRSMVRSAVTPEDVRRVMENLRSMATGDGEYSASDQIAAAKVFLERVLGKPTQPAVAIEMPEIRAAKDIPKAFAAVIDAVRDGRVSPDDLSPLTDLLRAGREAFGVEALQEQIDAMREEVRRVVTRRGA